MKFSTFIHNLCLARGMGVYIHIPYCAKACNYCDFYFSTNLSNKALFIESLLIEIELFAKDWQFFSPIRSIYFGGGTPSKLSPEELRLIIEKLRLGFPILPGAEVTIELNPEDATIEILQEYKAMGINRLSIGIQSFDDQYLRWMNRGHTVQQAVDAVQIAHFVGITNISIDLIYMLPGMTLELWRNSILKALELNVNHISAYTLTVEPKTLLAHEVKKGSVSINEDDFESQFDLLIDLLAAGGFEHYELSNFAKPSFYSLHNSSYWLGYPYWGIGPSAHSFKNNTRYSNVANIWKYIDALQAYERAIYETEQLTKIDQFNEYVMIRLRTSIGMDIEFIEQNFGINIFKESNKVEEWILKGYLTREGSILKLTRKGFKIANTIISDLFC